MARVGRLHFGISDDAKSDKMTCHCGLFTVELAEAADAGEAGQLQGRFCSSSPLNNF